MLNSTTYNHAVYDWTQVFLAEVSTDDIIFNWLGLQNQYITISEKDDDNLPDIDLSTFQNPMLDGGGVLRRRYTNKKITFKWFLKGDYSMDLNNIIDIFKQKTSAVEWYLDIKVNGFYRRTKATVVSHDIMDRKHYNITVVPFSITFQTLEPFFYDRDNETISENDITGDTSIDFGYFGTATSQPKVYLIFSESIATTQAKITLNSRSITVNENINDWDVLIFDSITKTVLLNNIEIDYVGTFPTIVYGDNLIQFEVNGTPSYDITVLYATNYL